MNIEELRKQYLAEVHGSTYLDYTGVKSEQYIQWLEQKAVNKNDLLQRVSTRLLEMEVDAYHEALNYQSTGETYREIASNGLAKGYADAIKLLNENGC